MAYVFEKLKQPIIGYKKTYTRIPLSKGLKIQVGQVTTLLIPKGATVGYNNKYYDINHRSRYGPKFHKLRASSAKVLENSGFTEDWYSGKDFNYTVGKTVRPTSHRLSLNKEECAAGIHFFLTYKEAADW